jgi:hypothetical protein
MNIRKCTLIIALILSIGDAVFAAASVKKVRDTAVDSKALNLGNKKYGDTRFSNKINGCSFQQEVMATHMGYQYIGYYDGKRQVCLARRKLPLGKWDIIRFDDYTFKNNDAHNTISIGISPANGTIHIAFDHHGHPLHYRVSKKGAATNPRRSKWRQSLFSPIISELEKGKSIKITYPRFWQTPDGGLQFCYRHRGSGNGIRMLVDYEPKTGTWCNTRQIDSSKGRYGKSNSRCSYPNGYTYGPKGYLHTTWVWREGPKSANHDLMYSYSKDNGVTWLNSNGDKLTKPAAVDTPGITVVKIPEEYGLMNTHGQAVDSKGRIHTVMLHCDDASLGAANSKPGESRFGPTAARRYFHYFWNTNGKWETRVLPGVAGNRPKVFLDKKNNGYLIFQKASNLIIMGAHASTSWKDWKMIHTEKGPFGNEIMGDFYRWKKSGILSVMVQEKPKNFEATPLRIIDFRLNLSAR